MFWATSFLTTAFITAGLIGESDCWIGLTDAQTEGVFLWDDGTALDYEKWVTSAGRVSWRWGQERWVGDEGKDDRTMSEGVHLKKTWIQISFMCKLEEKWGSNYCAANGIRIIQSLYVRPCFLGQLVAWSTQPPCLGLRGPVRSRRGPVVRLWLLYKIWVSAPVPEI